MTKPTATLGYLLSLLSKPSILLPAAVADLTVSGLALDSRHVETGDLFLALQGGTTHGQTYIRDAIRQQARAVWVETVHEAGELSWCEGVPIIPIRQLSEEVSTLAMNFWGCAATKMPIIGVTGTNGKTTCTHFIASLLEQAGQRCGVIGTLGYGFLGAVEGGTMTTPNAVMLHKIFAEFYRHGASAIAMEVTSHSLTQRRVQGIEFAVGVFTNLTQDHLDYHGTMAAYGQAKQQLFECADKAVINGDDAFGRSLLAQIARRKPCVVYSVQNATTQQWLKDTQCQAPLVVARDVQFTDKGMTAFIQSPWGEGSLTSALLGQFNLSNVLAALATLCALNLSFADSLRYAAALTGVSGRMQVLGGGGKPLVVIDYAHTPDALQKVLMTLRAHCAGTLFCVFGCGGDRDKTKRPLMAAIAETYADHVTVTDDNPRFEDPVAIVHDIMAGFCDPARVKIQHERSKAIQDVIHCAQPGDCILVAGKGAEAYQLIGHAKIPFRDIDQVRKSLMG